MNQDLCAPRTRSPRRARRWRVILSAAALVVSALVLTGPAYASDTIVVNTNADTSTGSACSLREALALASGSVNACGHAVPSGAVTIRLAALTYKVSTALRLTPTAGVTAVTVAGAGRSKTVLDGQGRTDILIVGASAAHVSLNDLTLQHGWGSQSFSGGAAVLAAAPLTITRSNIVSNNTASGSNGSSATNGGALYVVSSLVINDSLVADNFTGAGGSSATAGGGGGGNGGAIYGPLSCGSITISNSTFEGNYTGRGGDGGMALSGLGGNGGPSGTGGAVDAFCPVTIAGSTFADNWTGAGGTGGPGGDGIASGNGGAAANGGAVDLGNGGTVVNSTFTNNYTGNPGIGGAGIPAGAAGSGGDGGAINDANQPFYVAASTIAFNHASAGGGLGFLGATGHLDSSIVASNHGTGPSALDNCVGSYLYAGYNVISGDPGLCAGRSYADPRLGSLANNGGPTSTIAISAGSSAIGLVPASNCVSVDQRGAIRGAIPGMGGKCTAGAVEWTPPTVEAVTSAASGTTTGVVHVSANNPDIQSASVFVRYGLTTSYGHATAGQVLHESAGAVSMTFHLSGLTPGRRYYVDAIAANPDGRSSGTSTFATHNLPLLPASWITSFGHVFGAVKVGSTIGLTPVVLSSTGARERLSFTYSWLLDGHPVTGLHTRTVRIPSSWLDHSVTEDVTVSKPGYRPQVRSFIRGRVS